MLLAIKKFFQQHLTQYILLFIVFIILAAIFLNTPLTKINTQLPQHVDAYLVTWVWSWENHILATDPLNFFNANIFAPYEDTLAYTETMLGTFLLAWPILLIFHNIILAYNIVVLLTFAISGLGMYLLVYYLTKNKLAALLAALIYAFAPFKLIHAVGHLHLTGMWLPYVFLYLHKFFEKQSWKNIWLLTLFIILVFLTGFHYFIFLPIVILVFFLIYYLNKKFKFNKANVKKIVLSLIISASIIVPIILPYVHLKHKYDFFRPLETVESYSPDLVDYLIPPLFYSYYRDRPHLEMVVSPGIVISLLFILALYYIFKIAHTTKLTQKRQITFYIYFVIALVAFVISFGFYIQFTENNSIGIPTFYSLFYAYLPGFDGIRAVGRYSLFVLLSIAIFIGYGVDYYFRQQKNIFKKNIIFFLILLSLFIELSFVPAINYSAVKLSSQEKNFFTWLTNQSSNKIFLHLPAGNRGKNILDTMYVYNSRFYFKKIVNGYSGYLPTDYLKLISFIQQVGPKKSLSLLKKFKVNYLIYHFDFYKQPELTKKWYLKQLGQSKHFKYITHFGNNYVYEINYD